MFEWLKDYAVGFKDRFVGAPPKDQGMLVGGVTVATYAAIRAATIAIPLKIPLAGKLLYKSASTRFILGALAGGIAGSTMGNRFGQVADKFINTDPEEPLDNQTFMMKTAPFVCAVAANVIIICFPVPGGNAIFGAVHLLTDPELHILTTLTGAFTGGTFGYRGGKFIDYWTNKTLVMDLGLTRAYGFFADKFRSTNPEPEKEFVPTLCPHQAINPGT